MKVEKLIKKRETAQCDTLPRNWSYFKGGKKFLILILQKKILTPLN